MDRISPWVLLLSLAALPAAAQTRSVVVPPESSVVIGPRGAPPPRLHLAPAPRPQQRMVMVAPSGETLAGPSALAAAGLAAAGAAAALFAGAGGGSSGGGSATASTAATRR
ncbi:hypothetical protein KPL78_02435 [Roseomonas sp. HJA6]|uniref:Uncharacterized protein n=1 Tax=Roseomonas alba TaxID=2846776 RepID=A0ABS7A3F0_9PROT|nr:hypothetical protein [Neoroseomonas alba]MBW6396683.1 hypothetical protein [Neoroseomonas alba]